MVVAFIFGKMTVLISNQPLQAIIILELVLYMLFGVVQLIQGFFPNGNRKIEASYILLSLFAKFFLGVMLFANVMFT